MALERRVKRLLGIGESNISEYVKSNCGYIFQAAEHRWNNGTVDNVCPWKLCCWLLSISSFLLPSLWQEFWEHTILTRQSFCSENIELHR